MCSCNPRCGATLRLTERTSTPTHQKPGALGGPGGSPQASRNDTLALTRTLVAIARRRLVLLRVAFQRTLERSVECGLRFLVLLLRDLALLVFHLELEDFFFQSFEQH